VVALRATTGQDLSDSNAMTEPESSVSVRADRSPRDRHVDLFIALVVIIAVAAVVLTAVTEYSNAASAQVNWPLFALFAALLFVGETATASWMRMGNGGVVTMSWTFAFSLVLLGSPTGAVAALALTTLIGELRSHHDVRRLLFNTAQVSMALAFGGLTLYAFGIDRSVTSDGSIPITTGLAIVCSGLVVFFINGVTVCYVISVTRGDQFMRTMRDGFAISMAVDGALLALAPIFLVSVQFSVVMAPLLLIAVTIVYRSAVQAIDRAHEANHDTLTELRNRRSFVVAADQFLAERTADQTATVLLIDLDGFKGINDRLGHQVGDEVLRTLARRLEDTLPNEAVSARLGGDEFAALIPTGTETHGTLDLVDLHERLIAPMTIDGVPISVGASIGAATCPEHGETSTDLLHAADIAMYRAKQFQTGVEHHDITSPINQGRRAMLRLLADAVGSDQLTLRYEPLMHIRDGVVRSVEAQLCWRHPTLGEIPSNEFIGFAEPTDLIGPITEFAIERAVRDIAALDDSMSISVNVSGGVLHRAQFAKRTLSVLHRLNFAPDRLQLEITERSLSSEPDRARASLAELRAAGVRIVIDDFGTGYSSYLTLRDLKIDRIKIAETFVSGMHRREEDLVIVQSVVDLAHGLDIDVVAVGVHAQAELSRLATMGCDVAQGALVAVSMDIDGLTTWRAGQDRNGMSAPQRLPLVR
jgi:diguanylate cyclase (GGDEF)-like protein